MYKGSAFSLLVLNKFNFGNQKVSQFVIFECKYLFSIICFYFHKSNNSQDRFHTHAFNAISIKLFGTYEEYCFDELNNTISSNTRTQIFKYFPRNSFHKIGNSIGCFTVLFAGPWKKNMERKNGKWRNSRIFLE